MLSRQRATIADLHHIPGRAELVNGYIVLMPPAGALPGNAAGEIFIGLRTYVRQRQVGHAISGNAAFIVNLPHRESFCPCAAYYVGPDPGMDFYIGAPRFAAEVRYIDDYGPMAKQERTVKRSDYFAAGTLVVWDVDLLDEDVVKVYRASDPTNPTIYRRGEIAEAEPAVPGWTMPVDDLFA
ncbi:MAG TPA: Uma2 family endonuclease [Chthonomonadaceae bacterium]|nr:Uma2 family endonuclease [Chthonomonadaceae bacterium]